MKNIFQKATGRARAPTNDQQRPSSPGSGSPASSPAPSTSNEDSRTDESNKAILQKQQVPLSKDLQEKVDQLQGMFSDLSPFVISNTLKESNGDVERAVDSLLNIQAIESAREVARQNSARRDRNTVSTAHPEPPRTTYAARSSGEHSLGDPLASSAGESADPNAPAEDQLVHAARNQNIQKLKSVLESKSGTAMTSSWANALQNALNLTIATKNVEGIRLVMKAGARVDGPENTAQSRSPLGHAIHAAAVEAASVLLNEFHADPNKLSGPRSPLHMAVSSSMNNVVAMLLEKGADLNAIELDSGRTALHMAVTTGALDIVTLLLNSGLDIMIKDYSGETAPHLAFRTAKSQRDLILLHLLLERLRLISGNDVQNSRTGDTLLHIAAHRSQNSSQMFELVLKFLPNPFIPNASGQSSVEIAMLSPNDSVKALIMSYTETYPTVDSIEAARAAELEKLKKTQQVSTENHLSTLPSVKNVPQSPTKSDPRASVAANQMLPLLINSMAFQTNADGTSNPGINFIPVQAKPKEASPSSSPANKPAIDTNPFKNSPKPTPKLEEKNLIDPFSITTTSVPPSSSTSPTPLGNFTSNYASLPPMNQPLGFNNSSTVAASAVPQRVNNDHSQVPEVLKRASLRLEEQPQMALLPVQDPDYLLVKKFKESLEGDLAEFEGEYEALEAASTDQIYKGDFTSSLTKINLPKNRYRNILPLERTRVKLQELEGVESSDYINANYVGADLRGDRAYILTQGPLDSTAADFWRMIWEQRCSIVVMLSTFVEDGKSKVFPYFPVDDSEMDAGFFVVSLIEEKDDVQMITRSFNLKLRHTGESRTVMHLQYVAWPDQGIPKDTRGFRKIIDDADSLNSTNGPLVVHCSAGIGRSGVFCVVHSILTKLRALLAASFDTTFSIRETLVRMRLDRIALVQNKEQYVFCFMALRDTLAEYLDVLCYKNENWFHRTLNPSSASEKLTGKPPGSFLFSPSSQVGHVLLSRVDKDGKIVQEQILVTERGFVTSTNQTHERLSDLVKEMGVSVLSRHIVAQ